MVDWGFAETLAYASLLEEGYEIRLTGRTAAAARSSIGTRGPRPGQGATHIPLKHLSPGSRVSA